MTTHLFLNFNNLWSYSEERENYYVKRKSKKMIFFSYRYIIVKGERYFSFWMEAKVLNLSILSRVNGSYSDYGIHWRVTTVVFTNFVCSLTARARFKNGTWKKSTNQIPLKSLKILCDCEILFFFFVFLYPEDCENVEKSQIFKDFSKFYEFMLELWFSRF